MRLWIAVMSNARSLPDQGDPFLTTTSPRLGVDEFYVDSSFTCSVRVCGSLHAPPQIWLPKTEKPCCMSHGTNDFAASQGM